MSDDVSFQNQKKLDSIQKQTYYEIKRVSLQLIGLNSLKSSNMSEDPELYLINVRSHFLKYLFFRNTTQF